MLPPARVLWGGMVNLFTLRERGGHSREYFLDPLHLVSPSRDGVLVLRMGVGRLGGCSCGFCEALANLASLHGWVGVVECIVRYHRIWLDFW